MTNISTNYKEWLSEVKLRVRQSQLKAAVKVNTELIRLYWSLGKDISEKQLESVWGSGFFAQFSKDLQEEFPDATGFSETNIKYMKRFYMFYSQSDTIRQQAVDELDSCSLFNIPWGHHIHLFSKCKSVEEAMFYVEQTIENGWSRNVLMNVVETKLFEAKGKAITNFKAHLPALQSDLAQQTLKDPYNFDFLGLRGKYNERELEDALTTNITKFLLTLGSGFSYVGRQQRLEVGGQEFFIDLLFYHLKLRCYIVVELKVEEFIPEYVSKLGFYVSAVNHQLKLPEDQPTIGLLICKSKNEIVAQYTLESTSQPIGISEYQLSELYPKEIENALPSIEEIEKELEERTTNQE
ncbi:MAG: PDDEXK nuclease domain-containing protein [Rikenellaceae bacterium]